MQLREDVIVGSCSEDNFVIGWEFGNTSSESTKELSVKRTLTFIQCVDYNNNRSNGC
jgi:hypothetical protein